MCTIEVPCFGPQDFLVEKVIVKCSCLQVDDDLFAFNVKFNSFWFYKEYEKVFHIFGIMFPAIV